MLQQTDAKNKQKMICILQSNNLSFTAPNYSKKRHVMSQKTMRTVQLSELQQSLANKKPLYEKLRHSLFKKTMGKQ